MGFSNGLGAIQPTKQDNQLKKIDSTKGLGGFGVFNKLKTEDFNQQYTSPEKLTQKNMFKNSSGKVPTSKGLGSSVLLTSAQVPTMPSFKTLK